MKTILLSEGDPASINYELLAGSLPTLRSLSKTNRIILVRGNHKLVAKGFSEVEDLPKTNGLFSLRKAYLTEEEIPKIKLGKPSEASGRTAFQALLTAIQIQKQIKNASLVTLPLSKEWVIRAGISGFRGHTETLAEEYNTPTFMMMTGKNLKVIPLTTHVPISGVAEELTHVNWSELILAIKSTKLLKRPKICLLGLNPHSGEGGKIGREELDILIPKMELFRSANLRIEGPIPGDSAFLPEFQKKFDLFLACYHDQGLIPFKMQEGKEGVNVTLGLKFLRVSPDHGTAFAIAGKGKADPTGLISCLKLVTKA